MIPDPSAAVPAASTGPGDLTCARLDCPASPVSAVTGRCLACGPLAPQAVCGEHCDELTDHMMLGVVLSKCHAQPVTLVRVDPL